MRTLEHPGCVLCAAYAAFDQWCAENDPDCAMSVTEQADAYNKAMSGDGASADLAGLLERWSKRP